MSVRRCRSWRHLVLLKGAMKSIRSLESYNNLLKAIVTLLLTLLTPPYISLISLAADKD